MNGAPSSAVDDVLRAGVEALLALDPSSSPTLPTAEAQALLAQLFQVVETLAEAHGGCHRLAEAERRARALLARTFEAMSEAVFVVDPRSRVITDCNSAVERIFGHPREELLGRNTELLHVDREMYERFGRALFPALDAAGIFHSRFEMRRRDGRRFVSDHTVTEIRDARGERVGVVSVVRDVTEAHEVELQVRAQLDLLLAASQAQDLESTLRRCLETAIQVSGMDCGGIYLRGEGDELTLVHASRLSEAFVSATARYDADSANTRLVMGGVPVYCDHVALQVPLSESERREGLSALAVLPFAAEGRITGCLNLASHTTSEVPRCGRAAAESIASLVGLVISRATLYTALRESEERYRRLFDGVPDGVALIDAVTGALVECNQFACRTLEYTRSELLGLTIADIEVGESAEQVRGHVARVLHGGPEVFETQHRTRTGQIRDVRVTVAPIRIGGGPLLLSIWTDITDRRRLERELRAERQHLASFERAAQVREIGSFLAHELNQPLTGILSGAQGARRLLDYRAPCHEEIRQALDDIVDDGRRAAGIVASLRGMLRGEPPARRPTDINQIARDTIRLASQGHPGEAPHVRARFGRALPQVLVDPVQIRQVVLNLLSNAAQAAGDGVEGSLDITVTTRLRHGLGVMVSVADRGPGIPSGDLERVFEALYTTRPEGLGLGLAICRSLVEAHGGRIWAERRRGGGARVCFTLPVQGEVGR